MLPVENKYGPWPISGKFFGALSAYAILCFLSFLQFVVTDLFTLRLLGEIDIMEARGNGPSYPKQCVFILCLDASLADRLQ